MSKQVSPNEATSLENHGCGLVEILEVCLDAREIIFDGLTCYNDVRRISSTCKRMENVCKRRNFHPTEIRANIETPDQCIAFKQALRTLWTQGIKTVHLKLGNYRPDFRYCSFSGVTHLSLSAPGGSLELFRELPRVFPWLNSIDISCTPPAENYEVLGNLMLSSRRYDGRDLWSLPLVNLGVSFGSLTEQADCELACLSLSLFVISLLDITKLETFTLQLNSGIDANQSAVQKFLVLALAECWTVVKAVRTPVLPTKHMMRQAPRMTLLNVDEVLERLTGVWTINCAT